MRFHNVVIACGVIMLLALLVQNMGSSGMGSGGLSHAVQALKILLLGRLHRDEAHRRPRGRIEDRLCVDGIVLGPAHERLDEPWVDQAHLATGR